MAFVIKKTAKSSASSRGNMLQEVMIGKRFVTKLRTMQATQKGGLDEENRAAGIPNREGCTSHKEQQLPKLNKDKMEVHREILL